MITENARPGQFIVAEVLSPEYRQQGVIAEGQNLTAGTVLGKIDVGGKYTALAPAASDGSETAAAILYDDVNATDADQEGLVISRLAVVNGDLLTWPDGIIEDDKADAIAALETKFLIVK
ncbi:MAG: head decoration protein [Gammaproteobacteria bacterium]|nr:head decoration protein [Gammaproteobacteria bacterium]